MINSYNDDSSSSKNVLEELASELRNGETFFTSTLQGASLLLIEKLLTMVKELHTLTRALSFMGGYNYAKIKREN